MIGQTLTRMMLLAAAGIALGACAGSSMQHPSPDDPRFAPVRATEPSGVAEANGSIYQRGRALDLYQRRAHRVGDVLTVRLDESTTASKSSDSSFSRESNASVGGASLFGQTLDTESNVEAGSEFGGESNAGQSNQLSGDISVTVTDVLPNGLLEVRGEKWLELNYGSEYIRISGLVRREDIAPDNSIVSTRVADVRIAYSGTGTLADADDPGWLTRLFTSDIWPF